MSSSTDNASTTSLGNNDVSTLPAPPSSSSSASASSTSMQLISEHFVTRALVDASSCAVLLVATHGGIDAIPGAPKRTSGVIDGDQFTRQLTLAIRDEMHRLGGDPCTPHVVLCDALRLFVDCNRGHIGDAVLNADIAPPPSYMSNTLPFEPSDQENPAKATYDAFHAAILARIRFLAQQKKRALLVDVHGNSFSKLKGTVYITGAGMQSTGGRPLRDAICGHFDAEQIKCFQPEVYSGDGVFTGGYINHHYGREVENCDALQIEIHRDFRVDVECARETGTKIGRALIAYLKSTTETQVEAAK